MDRLFDWANDDTPGCSVAVAKDGSTIFERAYGTADLEHNVPNTTETLFEAGSVAKQFTAAAILLLVNDGRLKLRDDIRSLVPEMPDYGEPITIDHLLNHTSGLRDWGDIVAIGGWPRGTRYYSPVTVLDILRRQRSLDYRTGSEYSYTNSGYNLLATVVERVSGKTLAQFTRERIFVPLRMNSTQWRDDFRRVVKNRAIGYAKRGPIYVQAMPFEDAYGNGGLISTTGDLLRWNDALSSARLGRFVTDQLQINGTLRDGHRIRYARGLTVQRYRGVPEVFHHGLAEGYRAWLGRYPEQRLSIALLCNSGGLDPISLARKVAEPFLPAISPAVGSITLPSDAAELAGVYVNQRTGFPMRLAVEGGSLKAGGRHTLEPIGDARFRYPLGELVFAGRDAFRAQDLDGQIFEYRRAPAGDRPRALSNFTGRYLSDEADASYQVTVENGALVMRLDRRPETVLWLAHIYGDVFEYEYGIVRFHFAADGRAQSLGIATQRVRDLRFLREQ